MTGPEMIEARNAAIQRYQDAVHELIEAMTALSALDIAMMNRHVSLPNVERPGKTFQVSPSELCNVLAHPDAMPHSDFPGNYQKQASIGAEAILAAHRRAVA